MSGNIKFRSDVTAICKIFDDYINSLPENVRDSATNFFYSQKETADLRSEKFKLFDNFAGSITFTNPTAKKDYYEMAKKYYFAFLMESGGQSKVNEVIKEKLYQNNFCFSQIDNIISAYFNGQSYNHNQKKNDYMAFLRNERQILFYYGFFHSKSSGSNDKEFSSLTPVGKLALKSNFYEFIAIWEHQKLKMISQPVTVDIQNIEGQNIDYEKFTLNTNPYLTILQWLSAKSNISNEEYQYIISRLAKPISEKKQIDALTVDIEKIKNHIQSFKRRADVAGEDFQKELKKYLLGIRSDFDLDQNCNPLALCKLLTSKIELLDKIKLDNLIKLYSTLSEYKATKYSELFEKCQTELQRQYKCDLSGLEYEIDGKIKIEWDMYNIHTELPVLLLILIFIIQTEISRNFETNTISIFADKLRSKMPNILKELGLYPKQSLTKELKLLLAAFENSNFEKYLHLEQSEYDLTVSKYQIDTTADLKAKIEEVSALPTTIIDGTRKRNTNLIQLIRAYNNQNFAQDKILTCECCGHTTFLTFNDETYLEYHHLIPFSSYDGPDHYLNIYALCPSCHRKLHYIKQSHKGELYSRISVNNYIHKTIEERLKNLFHKKRLCSYQLEFLLSDNAITQTEYENVINS